MAGKTGTAAVNYAKDGGAGKYYASSFVGYFPADKPKYS
jgi:cell division protein FtsI (penicillin-binding protein 3)